MMNEFKEFCNSLDRHIGRENGFKVKEKARELEVKTSKIYSWIYKVKKLGIPIWNHKIPNKKERLFCISKEWEDVNDVRTDLGGRMTLCLFHAQTQDTRARQLRIEDDIVKDLKIKVQEWKAKKVI